MHVVGDVMADASRLAREIVNENGTHYRTAIPDGIEEGSYAVLTLHRAENTDSPTRLSHIVHALNSLALPIVFPIHQWNNVVSQHAFHVNISSYGSVVTVILQYCMNGYHQVLSDTKAKLLTYCHGITIHIQAKECGFLYTQCRQ